MHRPAEGDGWAGHRRALVRALVSFQYVLSRFKGLSVEGYVQAWLRWFDGLCGDGARSDVRVQTVSGGAYLEFLVLVCSRCGCDRDLYFFSNATT